jgi:hypothetical protein
MATATEFSVTLENRPGTLADLMEALGNADVNVEGLQGMPCGGEGIVHFVTNNPSRAEQALRAASIPYTTRQVLLLNIPNQPGAGGRVARAMADAGVNVDGSYVTFGGQVVIGVDNLAQAQEVAGTLGVL